ncbi:GNAT family N-acetyltransferase [Arenibacter certesii]|uniref:N-acetyltransferase n=1 Tax=Arenibacter certesii TaxID=228955 RepID=A0A918MMG6_9FLAO|nr:GNAT family N-acetyltransferase [Arenibacter certesii]GGW38649.1 N-acetyltransferase [Arenibacter certesii]
MEIQIILCSVSDLAALINLGKCTFTESFEEQNNPDDFNHYLETAFCRTEILKDLEDPNTSYYFVTKDAIKVGYFKVNQAKSQTDIKDDLALELERIYVLKEFQGNGIGGRILNWVIKKARFLNKKYLWLGVWEYNLKAINFYKQNGFKKFGTHPYYIGKDKQTDWLMKYEL